MFDEDVPSSEHRGDCDPALSRELASEWEAMTPVLLRTAYRCSGSRDVARELVQEAYVAIRQGRRKWNRAVQPSLRAFVCSVVGSLWANRQSSAQARRETGAGPESLDGAPNSHPNPEQLNVMKEEHDTFEELLAALRASCERDPLAAQLIQLIEDGVHDPTEQAEQLGVTYEAVYNARRRVRYALERLRGGRGRAAAARRLETEGA